MDLNYPGDSQGTSQVGVRKQNNNCRHRKRNPNCTENASHYFCEFCDKTSMHGFNLLVERGRMIPERIYWIIVIIVAAYFSVALVDQAYKKWLHSPVVVTFATSETPIWEIPFPAITICPQVISQVKQFSFTNVYLKKQQNNATINETKEFNYMSLVCHSSSKLLNPNETTTDERAVEFLKKVAPNFKDMFLQVTWLGDPVEADDMFSPILTSEGVCYTANMLDRSELFTSVVTHHGYDFTSQCTPSKWSLESGYSADVELFDSCPMRTLSAGTRGGLLLDFVTYSADIDYLCKSSQGFKVYLHNPAEVPRAERGYFLVPLDQAVVAAVKPKMMSTSEDLVDYKPEKRQCYFSSEKSLRFFKIYNQENCLIECLTNFTFHKCGCVKFHMPRENSTPICSASRKKCTTEARSTFLIHEQKYKMKQSGKTSNLPKESLIIAQCNCLPACTSLEYDTEFSQTDWEWREYQKIVSLTPHENKLQKDLFIKFAHVSRLEVFFTKMQFLSSERNELRGQLELWSDFGGLLGLFMGFSFISAFELIYYLTLRLACNIRLFGRHYWSGSEELLEIKEKTEETELEVFS